MRFFLTKYYICSTIIISFVCHLALSAPVILNTDIGHDIDDTWALALLLCSKETDLQLVVTENGDTQKKAALAAKFLQEAGRTDIPVGIGIKTSEYAGPQSVYAKDFDLNDYKGQIHQDGIAAIHDVVQKATDSVTLLALGPSDNIQELIKRYPESIKKINVIAMGGSIYQGYDGIWSPDAEYNIRTNVKASRELFNADWSLTLAPLDVSSQIRITGADYQRLLESIARSLDPDKHIVRILINHYQTWINESNSTYVHDSHSSILYDIIPVVYLNKPELFEKQLMKLIVTDSGFTKQSSQGKMVNVLMSVVDKKQLINDVVNNFKSQ